MIKQCREEAGEKSNVPYYQGDPSARASLEGSKTSRAQQKVQKETLRLQLRVSDGQVISNSLET